MTKTFVAKTTELDDSKVAVLEIMSYINSDLMKNTIGIVACHYEYMEIFKEICDGLPFKVVGSTSTIQSIDDEPDALTFTMLVITSDELEFVLAATDTLNENPGGKIRDAYNKNALADKTPSLILTFVPFMFENSGDAHARVITEVSGGVPCFGTIGVDDTSEFENSLMLLNGESYKTRLAMLLIYGSIAPKFFFANISSERLFNKTAVITKSQGHIIMEVNGHPVSRYFEDLGLTKASETRHAMNSLPFLLDYNDGTALVSKVFIALTPENYALCASEVPEGCTLYISNADKDDIFLTTGSALDEILKNLEGANCVLMYSCLGRQTTLGADFTAELDLVNKKLGGKINFMIAGSGGEFCPTQTTGQAVNRFHNNAFVACVL